MRTSWNILHSRLSRSSAVALAVGPAEFLCRPAESVKLHQQWETAAGKCSEWQGSYPYGEQQTLSGQVVFATSAYATLERQHGLLPSKAWGGRGRKGLGS
ncbi:hypothetical protein BDW66DRAFT_155982 [Aspergillus desertorum]